MNKILLIALMSLAAAMPLAALTANDLNTILDTPAGVTFTAGKGGSKASEFSDDNIGTGKSKVKIYPTAGSTMLKLDHGGTSGKEFRSDRINASFSFTVHGAGALKFDHRVATYCNDDVLIFYEDDIEYPLLELGSEYWYKKTTDDGEIYWGIDTEYEDFWYNDDLYIDTTRYTHTINVAAIIAYKDEYYWPPESDEIVKHISFLDNFVWIPDEDAVICDFFTNHPSDTFKKEGMEVSIVSDYTDGSDLVLQYWYTTDGSKPQARAMGSKLYDDEAGITLPGTLPPGKVTVRVAAYEGATLLGEYSHTYTRDIDVGVPTVSAITLDDYAPQASITLACEASTQDLTYHYTTDGTDPTTSSPKAAGNTVTITKPCTLKVIATDGAEQSEAPLTLTVTQTTTPALSFTIDGKSTANMVFSSSATVTASGTSILYKSNGASPQAYTKPVTVSSTSTLEFVAQGKAEASKGLCQLNSAPAQVTLTQESVNDGAWLTAQVEAFQPDEWNLLAVSRVLSDATSAKIIAWLNPFGYNDTTKCMEKTSTLRPGAAYLVHPSMVNDAKRPSSFADAGTAAPLQKDKVWLLSTHGAKFTLDGSQWVQAPQSSNLPGWRKE